MTSSPRITVVTPSFNQAAYLGETLRSVLSQREEIWEYFVIDGGSEDESPEIIRRHEDQIDYWVSEKDRGQADAINKGFRRATGDVLFWLNSDDILAPGAIARVKAAFEANPQWDVLTGYSVFLDSEGRITKVNYIPRETRWWAGRGVLHVCQQTCYFQKTLYDRVGGIDEALHCALDTELWLKFFEAGASWGHIPAILGGFRIHQAMKGKTWVDKYEREWPIVAKSHPWYPTHLSPWALSRLLYRAMRLGRIFTAREQWARRLIGATLLSLMPSDFESGRGA